MRLGVNEGECFLRRLFAAAIKVNFSHLFIHSSCGVTLHILHCSGGLLAGVPRSTESMEPLSRGRVKSSCHSASQVSYETRPLAPALSHLRLRRYSTSGEVRYTIVPRQFSSPPYAALHHHGASTSLAPFLWSDPHCLLFTHSSTLAIAYLNRLVLLLSFEQSSSIR